MLIAGSSPQRLGVPAAQARLRFGLEESPTQPSMLRSLLLSGRTAFSLTLWCGTCPILFERREGANETMSGAGRSIDALEHALTDIDDGIVATFAALLEVGDYVALLVEVRPELVAPNDDRDYFTHEQVDTWGVDAFWGLPHDPRSFYYRMFQTAVDDDAHLYEFAVPMVPPAWNDRERVAFYADAMSAGRIPTAVAVSTLDVCAPATIREGAERYEHWGLSHFVLDGHHKFEAAAQTGSPVRLLCLVSVRDGVSTPEQVARLTELRARESVPRRQAL